MPSVLVHQFFIAIDRGFHGVGFLKFQDQLADELPLPAGEPGNIQSDLHRLAGEQFVGGDVQQFGDLYNDVQRGAPGPIFVCGYGSAGDPQTLGKFLLCHLRSSAIGSDPVSQISVCIYVRHPFQHFIQIIV